MTAPSPGAASGTAHSALDTVWYTRCPVPTASGLALHRGTLAEEFASRGLDFGVLQDGPPELARHHFDHRLVGLFREGGNVPALAALSEGAPNRLIGLTWIDEWQSILVRPDSGIRGAGDLKGVRAALPAWADSRAGSFPRAMALHGFAGALATAGLGLADVRFVEVGAGGQPGAAPERRPARADGFGAWPGLAELASGEVDAVYVKGAKSAEDAAALGAVVAVDLDAGADRRFRVNNGTPRPITVHEQLLAEHEDLVVAFLARTLRAADWAAGHPDEVRAILAHETRSGSEGVDRAYRPGFHLGLHPDLSAERLELLRVQKDFLLVHGFLAADIDLDAWTADEPLAKARALVAAESAEGAAA
ncbi:ABC transporter substrate-binding protein [Yinghuangia sp. ASG 101]|uniref:ABC transporter substrate-binding protein n=1 Tax=Yinghuangia sp. ASG 101 TaxID=2896848 RepID=UPI001E54DAA6|nr:ABC transporter substrate-binding protein [Yinghuangia sp. ASG 101]UGQ12099.1 ABC transporter substrate-binding protein [Yinghuangia sp. ASG 101]